MGCLDWIAAAGSLVAATGASIAACHAAKLLTLEKKREGERDVERKKARLVATIERDLVQLRHDSVYNAEWAYLLRIRNYGESEARAIEVEVVSIRRDEQEVSDAVTGLRYRLKKWDVRCLGPGGWFDLLPLHGTDGSTIELRVCWEDSSDSPGEYHTQLYQGPKPVG